VDKLLAPFTGQNKDFGDVQRALEALQQAYISFGFGVVQVNLPEQELEDGVVQFQVAEARLGKVTVEGNQFFSSENVRASLPTLKSGEPPNTRRIASNLRVANENPAKQTNVLLKSSADEEGAIDATVRVTDQKPWHFAITLDNTGSPDPAESRMGFAYQHANLFNRDHVLNLQYITSPENISDVTI
jgi:hemolysin activation/secretion protein